jgi:hypothetical protein
MAPAKGCQLSFILRALVSFEYQIADAKRLAAYMLDMIFLKGLLIFLLAFLSAITKYGGFKYIPGKDARNAC